MRQDTSVNGSLGEGDREEGSSGRMFGWLQGKVNEQKTVHIPLGKAAGLLKEPNLG